MYKPHLITLTVIAHRFFAKVVEILARYFARLDVSIDTFGLFSVRGIQIRLNGQRTLVSQTYSSRLIESSIGITIMIFKFNYIRFRNIS